MIDLINDIIIIDIIIKNNWYRLFRTLIEIYIFVKKANFLEPDIALKLCKFFSYTFNLQATKNF